mgnify:CR=1 FL=1
MTRTLFSLFTLIVTIGIINISDGYAMMDPDSDKTLDQVHYKIILDGHDEAHIQYSFVVKDSILRMSSMGANQFDERWAKFVSDLSAISENGKTIPLKSLPDGQWSLDAEKGEKVNLNYTVHLDHEKHEWSGGIDGVAYKQDHGVFYSGRSLFIMNGRGDQSVAIDFVLPDQWKVSTVWDKKEPGKNSFKAASYNELSESMLFAGEHEQLVFRRDGFELLLALGGDKIISKKKEYENLASGVLDYYIELMGGVPNPSPQNPFHRALVIINPSEQADGEVIGNSISILESSQEDPMAKMISRFIYAHELFHLWNGKSFFPSDQRCEWFKEGVSNYYTLKSLYHVGVLNEESYFGMLNGFFYKRYAADPGIGSISMTEGEEKHDHWGIIYSGGLFAGISQDMIIRKETNNQYSLDDLMRKLLREHGGTNESYTLEDLQSQLSELSGKSQDNFFEDFVMGTQKIPLDSYLKLSGLESEIQEEGLKVSRSPEESAEESEMIQGLFGTN